MRRAGGRARPARAILAVVLLAATVRLNAATLIEAYGAGSPHYGRTTNMDKWTDPLPWLLPFDAVTIAVALALVCRKPRELG